VKKLTTVGQEVYATLMLVALLIDIALAVLIFSHGVGWGIAYLIAGTWIFFLAAHRLAVLA
jgi:F0F1-type ATP synthase assembly protein I